MLDFNVGGVEVPGWAALIVENRCISGDNGLLGMNIISGCWKHITRGGVLSKTAFKSRVPMKAWGAWEKAFTFCQWVHRMTLEEISSGMAKLRRQAHVIVPPELELVVWADVPTHLEQAENPVLNEDLADQMAGGRGWPVAWTIGTVRNGQVLVQLCNTLPSPVLNPQRCDLATVSPVAAHDIHTGHQVVLRDPTPGVLEVDVQKVEAPATFDHPALELKGDDLSADKHAHLTALLRQ